MGTRSLLAVEAPVQTFTLPRPPSKNALKTPISRGKYTNMIDTKAYRLWKSEARGILIRLKPILVIGPVQATIIVQRLRKGSDCHNYVQATLDILEPFEPKKKGDGEPFTGVIENDSLVAPILVDWERDEAGEPVKGDQIEITIEPR